MEIKKIQQKRRLVIEIERILERELVIVLKNPYEEFNDIVEYVAIWKDYRENLYSRRELFIMTDESVEKNIGSGRKYIWYDRRWTINFMAHLILKDILKHNGNNLRIISKLKEYYTEAVERLRVDSSILDTINRDDILSLSN